MFYGIEGLTCSVYTAFLCTISQENVNPNDWNEREGTSMFHLPTVVNINPTF
jgi:hypothetical protein